MEKINKINNASLGKGSKQKLQSRAILRELSLLNSVGLVSQQAWTMLETKSTLEKVV